MTTSQVQNPGPIDIPAVSAPIYKVGVPGRRRLHSVPTISEEGDTVTPRGNPMPVAPRIAAAPAITSEEPSPAQPAEARDLAPPNAETATDAPQPIPHQRVPGHPELPVSTAPATVSKIPILVGREKARPHWPKANDLGAAGRAALLEVIAAKVKVDAEIKALTRAYLETVLKDFIDRYQINPVALGHNEVELRVWQAFVDYHVVDGGAQLAN